MKGFNWEKMGHTPEGQLIKSERGKSHQELIEAFAKQAGSDLDKHDRYEDLKRDIEKRHSEIAPEDEQSENVAHEIIRKHERTLREDKGLEDADEQLAYIVALVREIQRRKDKMH